MANNLELRSQSFYFLFNPMSYTSDISNYELSYTSSYTFDISNYELSYTSDISNYELSYTSDISNYEFYKIKWTKFELIKVYTIQAVRIDI